MGVLLDNVRQGLNLLFTPVLYYGVVASIAIQLTTWERGDRTQDRLQNQYQNQADNFDFIIIGGGTAGSVMANRLSQFYNILLLEAGGEPSPLQFVPGLARSIVNHPQVDWMHKTVAQKKSCAFSQFKRASWPSGKTLGGSGSLDFLTYLRGNPEDFDNWARIAKDDGWKYDNLLKHFQRAEDLVANSTDPGAHRHGGELRIQKSDYLPLAKEFLAASKELGYKNVDLNGHFSEGFDYVYSTIKRGERQAPIRAFLDPVRKRKSLVIRKFAFVSKIKFRSDNTAYGVEYERHGEKHTAYANREIILSAGTLGSPKLLMLSGIGPKRHLEDFGIKPIVNLPVGQNLQDHVGTYLGPFFINEPLSFQKDRDITAESYVEYGAQGTGPLTTTGFGATGLVSSLYAVGRGEANWPDIQLTLYATSVDKSFATDLAHTHTLNQETLKKYYQHAQGKHSFHILTNVARPAGRGELRLASRNAGDPLVINPKYLEDPWGLDVKAGVDGLKKALRIVEGSTSFQNIGGRFTSEVLPGCEATKFRSDEYFECYLRQFTISLYNPVGTCAMGPVDSQFAVVDPKLRVIGTRNLRVVDASVMPSITGGGTLAPTIMIGEKAAEVVLEYWSKHIPEDVGDEGHTKVKANLVLEDSTTTAPGPTVDPEVKGQSSTPVEVKTSLLSTLKPLKPIKFSTQISKTETTTTKSVNLKAISPFSVTIKTSSPTPIPARKENTRVFPYTSTKAPKIYRSTTTTAPTTTTASILSFPILSNTKSPQKIKRKKPIRKYSDNSVSASTTANPQETSTFLFIPPTDKTSTTTPNPTQSYKSYSIHPAIQVDEEQFQKFQNFQNLPNFGNLNDVPTTYRPQIFLLNPEETPKTSVRPTERVKTVKPPKSQEQDEYQQYQSFTIRPFRPTSQSTPAAEHVQTAWIPQRVETIRTNSFEVEVTPGSFHSLVPPPPLKQQGSSPNPVRGGFVRSFGKPVQIHSHSQKQQIQSQSQVAPVSQIQHPTGPFYHQGHQMQHQQQSLPYNFNFNEAGDEDILVNDRFTRHNNRYLEKPIKIHTFRHPARVVRRFPKPTLSQSQSQIQNQIMAQLRRYPQEEKPGQGQIAGQGQGHNQVIVQPANVLYQEPQDSVSSGSDFVQNYQPYQTIRPVSRNFNYFNNYLRSHLSAKQKNPISFFFRRY